MKTIGAYLWFLPAAVHIGYLVATFDALPDTLGGAQSEMGQRPYLFIVEWFAILGLANCAFSAILIRLPRMSDRMLQVPGKEYWLATPERREEMIERLRGVCETTLLMLNVFFLAIYQLIYQTNVSVPIVTLPHNILVLAFMIAPLLILAVHAAATMRSLAASARNQIDENRPTG